LNIEPDKNVPPGRGGLYSRLLERGVLRVAISYALIAWLLLQIGDVVLEPLGAPAWVMRVLIIVVVAGFPVALLLAWFFELTPAGIEHDAQPEGAVRPTVRGARRYADVLIIGILAVAVVYLLVRQEGWIEEDQVQPVIGVLPFTDLGAGDDAYFGAGLADTLTYKLGLLKQLIVLAPSSTFQFRGQGQDLKLVGAKLGATALLEGTVRRARDMIRVNARLVDTGTGRQLWSGSYDRGGADLFAVQDEIAGAVTQALQILLSPEDQSRLTQPLTTSLTAYDAFILGRERLAQREHETIHEAVEYFRRAIELDPSFALAHAALAEAIFLTASYQFWGRDWARQGPEARRAAANALSLDPNLGEAYLAEALAAQGDNDFETGPEPPWPQEHLTALYKRAVELSPNNAVALKFYANSQDDPEANLELLKRAAQLDPRSGIIRQNIGEEYAQRGAFDEARDWMMQAALVSNPPFSLSFKSMIEMYIYDAFQPDVASRWGKALNATYPDTWQIIVGYTRALCELGAWDELHALLESLPTEQETTIDDNLFFIRKIVGPQLAAAEGDVEAAAELSGAFSELYAEDLPEWPDLTKIPGTWRMIIDIRLWADMKQGRAQDDPERYGVAASDPDMLPCSFHSGGALCTRVLAAVLQRLNGNPGEADRRLRDVLIQLVDQPISGRDGIGFERFTILAYLGETDAAIDEFRKVVDSGFRTGWWALKMGAFDASYAAVLEDPRFMETYNGLQDRVHQMLEGYRENPGLPEGQSID